jgi:TP901 family phage tail tape measure protein
VAEPVASGAFELTPDKEGLVKSLGGLGSDLKGTFGKLGGALGDLLGGNITGALQKVGSSVGTGGVLSPLTAGVIGAAAGAGVALFKLGSDFDSTYKSIQKSTGATGESLDALKTSFRNVASQTGASFDNISRSVTEVSKRTGATGADLEALSLSMLRLSSVAGVDLNTAIEKGSKAFTAWGLSAADMPAALDKIYVASSQTGIGADLLMTQLQKFGPTFRGLGLDMNESIALLANFERAGINTQKATRAMGTAFGNLAKQGVKDIPAAFKETVKAIQSAESPAKATEIAVATFGKAAGPELAEAIRAGVLSTDDLVKALGESEGALKSTASETATFSGKMAKFKNQMSVAFEPVAMGLFEGITGALLKVTPLLTGFANFVSWIIKNVPGMKVIMGAAVGVFVALTAAIVAQAAITKVASLSLGAHTVGQLASAAAAKVAAAAQWLLNAAMSANPIGIVVIAIIALVAAFVLLWTKCEGFRNFMTAMWEVLKSGVMAVKDAFVAAFDWIMEAIRKVWDWIGDNWPLLVGILGGPIGLAVAAIIKYWDDIWESLQTVIGWFKDLPGKIVAGLGQLGGLLLGWITAAWDWVKNTIQNPPLVGWFAEVPGKLIGALGDFASMLWRWITTAWDKALDGVKDAVHAIVDWLKGNWKTLLVAVVLGAFTGPAGLVAGLLLSFDPIKDFVTKTLPGWFKELPAKLGSALAGLGSSIVPDLSGLEDLPRTVGRMITDVVNTIKGLPGQMVGALSGMSSTVAGIVKGALSSVTNVLGGLGTQISGALKGLPGQITGALSGLSGALTQMGSQMIGGLSNGMRDASKWVVDVAKGIPGAVKGAIGNTAQWLYSAGQKVIGGLTNGIKGVLSWIGNAMGTVKGAAQGAVASAGNWLYGQGRSIIQGLINGVRSLVAQVRGAVYGVYGQAKAALSGAFGWLHSSGRAIIQGLINGIRSMVGAVRNAINSVLSAARRLLPFSPPKDRSSPFAGRGQPIYSGISIASQLAEGMVRATPLVAAAAAGMADAAHTGVTGRMYDFGAVGQTMARELGDLGGGTGGANYNLTMNVSEADTSQLQAGFRRLELLSGAA